MKYCLNYWRKSQYLNEVDELNIDFTAEDTDEFENFIKFLEKHPNQKINAFVNVKSFDNFFNNRFDKLFSSLWEERPEARHFAIRFYPLMDKPVIYWEMDTRVKNFLNDKTRKCPVYLGVLATSDELLNYCVENWVNEVYLSGRLAFELPFIAKNLHDRGVRIRLIPNLAQGEPYTNPLQKFFIRPEDVHFYNDYADVLEFYERGNVPDVVYEVYTKDKEWFGELEEIIYNLGLNDFTLNNRGILPQFGQIRTCCGRSCLTKGDCKICANIKEISEILKDKQIAIRQTQKS